MEQEKYARLRHLVENARLAKKIGPQVEALIFLLAQERQGSRQAQINLGRRTAKTYSEVLEAIMDNAKQWKARS